MSNRSHFYGMAKTFCPPSPLLCGILLFVLFLVYFIPAQEMDSEVSIPQSESHDSGTVRKSNILCLIMTALSRKNETHAVNQTWAKRCDKHFFVVGGVEKAYVKDDVMYLPAPESKNQLTIKVRKAFQYAHFLYKDVFDWIIKTDDDTFVIMENLRHMVSGIDPKTPAYLGLAMRAAETYEWGNTIALTSEALNRLIIIGFRSPYCKDKNQPDDVIISCCLAKAKVSIFKTLDAEGINTFHQLSVEMYSLEGKIPILNLTGNEAMKYEHDPECCSTYSVAFSKMDPDQLVVMEHLLYRTWVIGLYSGEREKKHIYEPTVVTKVIWKHS